MPCSCLSGLSTSCGERFADIRRLETCYYGFCGIQRGGKGAEMEVIGYGSWVYYVGEGADDIDRDRCGKWMWSFDDYDLAEELCAKAVEDGVVAEAKHNAYPDPRYDSGICCFYLDGSDEEAHEAILGFFLENDMIPRDGSGRLADIPFKYDWQTRAGLYGDDFVPEMTLSDFIDLGTGEWIR